MLQGGPKKVYPKSNCHILLNYCANSMKVKLTNQYTSLYIIIYTNIIVYRLQKFQGSFLAIFDSRGYAQCGTLFCP